MANRLAATAQGFLALMIVAATCSAHAGEPFLELYGGLSSTDDSGIQVTEFTVPPSETFATASFDTSATVGVRNGTWIGQKKAVGVAWELSFFRANAAGVDASVVSLSGLVLYRWRQASGKWLPYAGGGVSLINADVRVDVGVPPIRLDEGTLEDALELLGGVNWRIAPKNGVFFEYRYSHAELDIDPEGILSKRVIA